MPPESKDPFSRQDAHVPHSKLETSSLPTTHYPLTTISETAPACLPSPRACSPWPSRSSPTRSTCCAPTHSTHDLVERRFSAALRCLYCFVVITRGRQPPRDLLFLSTTHYPLHYEMFRIRHCRVTSLAFAMLRMISGATLYPPLLVNARDYRTASPHIRQWQANADHRRHAPILLKLVIPTGAAASAAEWRDLLFAPPKLFCHPSGASAPMGSDLPAFSIHYPLSTACSSAPSS